MEEFQALTTCRVSFLPLSIVNFELHSESRKGHFTRTQISLSSEVVSEDRGYQPFKNAWCAHKVIRHNWTDMAVMATDQS